MKTVYFAQVNDTYGDNAYLPYSAGIIIAAALENGVIRRNYDFKSPMFIKEDIKVAAASLKNPYMFAFSCYVWNFEYNKKLAEAVKKRYPECIIVFGGHHVPNGDARLLDESPAIDILIFGEGEQTFRDLLLALNAGEALDAVGNIAYRKKGEGIIITKRRAPSEFSGRHPSPYLTGLFDNIIEENKGIYNFSVTLETTRGCPYSCAYCDWGDSDRSLRQFPMDKVKAELLWTAKHRIEFVLLADSNFGILERDKEIVEETIRLKEIYGYPKKLRIAYAKNSDMFVFEINKLLNDCGLSKGATLSFQTFNTEALKNISRQNIRMDNFKELISLYKRNSIPTYSELIIGLPGENKESFKRGITSLLDAGQHSSMLVYNCELLPNADMNRAEYIEKHKIKMVRMPLYQYHCIPSANTIQEYSNIVVENATMTKDDWVYINMYSCTVSAFHCLGILRKIAIFLRYEQGIGYNKFYTELIEFIFKSPECAIYEIFKRMKNIFSEALKGFSLLYTTESTGQFLWPVEEGVFLDTIPILSKFYVEIAPFIQKYKIPEDVLKDLINYQRGSLSLPNVRSVEIELEYDLYSYFAHIAENNHKPLKRAKNSISLILDTVYHSINDYAKEVIWYGRKGGAFFAFEESLDDVGKIVKYI